MANPFEDLIPKDVPKGRTQLSPTENPFADLIPQQEGEQTSNIGAKGNMRPDDRPITDVQGQFTKGATFNFGDEIVAGLGVPVDVLVNALSGEGPTDPKEVYQQIRAFQASQAAATEEQKPIASTAANIGGALMPAGGGLKLIASAPSLIGKTIRGAGTGAVMGALSGAGEGEGLDERTANAVSGAETGAAVGALLPPVAKAVGQGVRLFKAVGRATTAPVRSLADAETFAAGKVAESLKRDRLTPERSARLLQLKQQVKPDTILADVGGRNTERLLRAAANVPSEGRSKMTAELFRRQEGQLDRLRGDIGSAFGDPKSFTNTVESLTMARKQAAKPLFDAAFQTGTPWTVQLQSVLSRPLTRKLVERAEQAAANRGEQFKSVFAQVAPNGKVTFSRVPDTEALHRIKMEIDASINTLKRGKETGLGNVQLRDLTILKRDLVNAIDNKTYKQALAQYAGDSAAVNAIDDGFEKGLEMEPDAITATLGKLSKTEADLWRLGMARKIVNQLRDSGGRQGTNRAELLYSPKYLDRMRAAFKDTKTGKDFMRKLALERQMFKTRSAVEGNSTTAAQLAEGMEAGVDADNIRSAADIGGKLARGDAIGALVSWVGRAKNMATGLRPEVADKIIQMLTSKDPAMIRRAQQLVQQEVAKLTRRQGLPQRIEQGVTTLGLGAIPSLSSAGQPARQ